MMLSLVLIEGQNVSAETLRSVSLGNAKQLVVGNADGFGVILHLAATTNSTFLLLPKPRSPVARGTVTRRGSGS